MLSSVDASFVVLAQNQEVAVQMQDACFLVLREADDGSQLSAVLELSIQQGNGGRNLDCEGMRPVMIRLTQLGALQ